MSEMIEKVGRALAAQEGYAYDPLPYDERAVAAIEAMREPTRAMLLAMETAVEDSIDSTTDTECTYDVWDSNTVANAVHRAMIDSALKP